ncbi:MAG TPA: ABC transporter substrate-binding protein [Bacillota bacterium]|nr:ABC transporter substrate-binding protein [Bacillota bacterium]
MMKFQLRLVVVVLVLALVAGIGLAASDTKSPYVVGVFCSATGPNAPLGVPERNTIMMLESQINKKGGVNGHPLKVIIEDDATDNTTAVKAVKKLIEQDQVCALIGSSGTSQTMAALPVAVAAEVPLVSMAAGAAITNPLSKWVFRTPQTDILAINRILTYLSEKQISKVAMIYDSNAYGTNGRDQLRKLAPGAKVSIVAEEAFATADTDMTVQLTKIRTTDAQAIICWGTNPAPAQVAKNAKQLGITIPLFMSHGVANQAFLNLAGPAADQIILPAGKLIVASQLPGSDPRKKLLLQYAKDYEKAYNNPADTFGGHGWDALNIIVKALTKAGDNRAALRDEIEKTTNFAGITGILNYTAVDHDGLTNEAFVMVQIKKGKWTLLKK